MKAQKIIIETQDGKCDAFVACPDDKTAHPAVLMLMDAFGPRDYLYEMATKLASRGYYVLLPNLFYRVRPAPVLDLTFPLKAEDMPGIVKTKVTPLFQGFSTEFCLRDIGVFLDFLAEQKEVLPGKAALTGYCLGGSLALRAASRFPDRIAAAASFHAGNLATEAGESPHRQLGNIKAEVYIAHADNDQSMPPEQIERLGDALEQSGIRYEAELYTGAAHGFTMADLPAYNEAALTRHWEKLSGLLDRSFKNRKAA
jgi:carboxymethylenebutenolidase